MQVIPGYLRLAFLIGTGVACGASESTAPQNIQGVWRLQVALTSGTATCGHSGGSTPTYTIIQNGSTFTTSINISGTLTCTGQTGSSLTAPWTNGRVDGATISFDNDLRSAPGVCAFTGTLSGTPSIAMSGTVTCAGGSPKYAGTWSASKN
jgi:hypothetical protein